MSLYIQFVYFIVNSQISVFDEIVTSADLMIQSEFWMDRCQKLDRLIIIPQSCVNRLLNMQLGLYLSGIATA